MFWFSHNLSASILSREDFSEILAAWLSHYVGVFLSFTKGRVLAFLLLHSLLPTHLSYHSYSGFSMGRSEQFHNPLPTSICFCTIGEMGLKDLSGAALAFPVDAAIPFLPTCTTKEVLFYILLCLQSFS